MRHWEIKIGAFNSILDKDDFFYTDFWGVDRYEAIRQAEKLMESLPYKHTYIADVVKG